MTTRATILSRAFARIGIAAYEFSLEPDDRADARTTLDAMLLEWATAGIDLGNTPSDGTDNDAIAMTTPEWADPAIWSNLALRLAADYGKAPGSGLVREARRGYDLAAGKMMTIPTSKAARSVVSGAGERYYRRYGW